MTKLEEMIQGYPIPKVCKIRQIFDRTRLDDPEEKLARLWAERDIPIRPGMRIAITGGSRGIAGYVRVMKTAVELVKAKGGMADFISHRLRIAVDEEATWVNALTGMHPEIARLPITLANDRLVFQGCVKASGQLDQDRLRLAIIRNTNALGEIYVSRAALDSIQERDKIQVCSEFMGVPFDGAGELCLFEARSEEVPRGRNREWKEEAKGHGRSGLYG